MDYDCWIALFFFSVYNLCRFNVFMSFLRVFFLTVLNVSLNGVLFVDSPMQNSIKPTTQKVFLVIKFEYIESSKVSHLHCTLIPAF